MRIIAIDPGGTTGWAQHTMFMDQITNPMVDIAGAINVGFYKDEHHGYLWSNLYEFNPDVIVYERFDYQIRVDSEGNERQKIDLSAKEYIGILKLWAAQHSKCKLVPQQQYKDKGYGNPSSQWTDDKLKHLGLYHPGTDGEHMNDAQRHLLSYIVFGQPKRVDYLKLLRRPH